MWAGCSIPSEWAEWKCGCSGVLVLESTWVLVLLCTSFSCVLVIVHQM